MWYDSVANSRLDGPPESLLRTDSLNICPTRHSYLIGGISYASEGKSRSYGVPLGVVGRRYGGGPTGGGVQLWAGERLLAPPSSATSMAPPRHLVRGWDSQGRWSASYSIPGGACGHPRGSRGTNGDFKTPFLQNEPNHREVGYQAESYRTANGLVANKQFPSYTSLIPSEAFVAAYRKYLSLRCYVR